MVACLLPTPHPFLDPRIDQSRREIWTEQDVIDPQPGIAFERTTEILPEGIDMFAGVA
jgi:hypothetical protein